MPKTVRESFLLQTGEDKEEISNVWIKYFNSIIELDENTKLNVSNINTENLETDYISLNTDIVTPPTKIGSIYWDEKDQVPTVVLPYANLQIGKEQYIDGLNKTGTTISNGSVVFVSGAQGNRMTIALADADNYVNSQKVIGISTHDIGNNVNGIITTFGLVRDLNTSDYNEGDCLYLSQTAGAFTTVTPSFGTARIKVGMIVKSHIAQGEVFCCVNEDKYLFGDKENGNYSGFESDGTYVAKGEAITWRDEYVGGQYFVPAGASAPDEVNLTVGGVVTRKYAFDGVNTTEKLGNTYEVAHDVAIDLVNAGTLNIETHIHCCASTTASGTATFITNWALLKSMGPIITGSNVTASIYFDGTQLPYCNRIFGGDLVTPTGGFGIGDLIEFTITRDPALVSDTYTQDVIFYKSALHVPLDTLGSRQRYIK